jgi:hypothetical protein
VSLAESHAAAARHTVIELDTAIGMVKKYIQFTRVRPAKQSARARCAAHERQGLRRKAPEPPREHCREQEKHADGQTEPDIEIPVGAAEPEDIEVA